MVDKSRAFRMRLLVSTAVAFSAAVWSAPSWAAACEDLVNLKLADTTIKSAESIPAGDYTTSDKVTRKDMPAFCRVVASVSAAPDSDVGLEIWLPRESWKGVFHAIGNGGYSGVLAYNYGAMEAAIKRGYASAVTDMGTAPATPLNGDALVGHPQKWKDWGSLSTHVATVVGKQIEKAFYGADAKHAYYSGGLRRHSRRRPGGQPDLGSRGRGVGLPGREPETGTQALRRQARSPHEIGRGRLRGQEQRP
jgi:hypothetical protein